MTINDLIAAVEAWLKHHGQHVMFTQVSESFHHGGEHVILELDWQVPATFKHYGFKGTTKVNPNVSAVAESLVSESVEGLVTAIGESILVNIGVVFKQLDPAIIEVSSVSITPPLKETMPVKPPLGSNPFAKKGTPDDLGIPFPKNPLKPKSITSAPFNVGSIRKSDAD